MEKAMRKGSEGQASTTSYDPSNMSLESYLDLPEELSISPPSNKVVVNLVEVYFRLLQDSFFNFRPWTQPYFPIYERGYECYYIRHSVSRTGPDTFTAVNSPLRYRQWKKLLARTR